jgi:hypothetical protein
LPTSGSHRFDVSAAIAITAVFMNARSCQFLQIVWGNLKLDLVLSTHHLDSVSALLLGCCEAPLI